MKFKVGDRVTNRFIKEGGAGTVKYVGNLIGVEWDKNIGGHNGNERFEGKDGHCWFSTPQVLNKVIQQEFDFGL